MGEVLSPLMVFVVGSALAAGALRRFEPSERGLLALGFLAHAVAAVAQVWITRYFYGGGDMMVYFVTGSLIADVVQYEPGRFFPELLTLFVHQPSHWPFYVMGAGSSTGTMSAASGLLQLILGESIYGVCMALSLAAAFGQLALYRVFRELFPRSVRQRLLVATMLMPSVVFWSSAILKETVAMAAFGFVVLGLHRFVQRRRGWGLFLIVAGGFFVAMVKAYILFALAAAAAVWWYWRRTIELSPGRAVSIRPAYLVLGGLAMVGLIIGLGELFPRYSFERVGEETARLQEVGARVGGGSYYEVADRPERSVAGQLAFAPLALLTSLFRPALVEIRNATMAVNALETTVLTVLFIRGIARRSWTGIVSHLRRSPTLMFSVVFILTFGVAVGLASTNLGTLSRYRIPMIPFFAALVLLWNVPHPHTTAPRRVRGGRPARSTLSRRDVSSSP